MKTLLFSAVLFFSATGLNAQETWLSYPTAKSDSSKANFVNLQYGKQAGKVTLHQDARIDKISEFVRNGESTVEGVKIDGFRIVVFFDQDKAVVQQQKANFLSRYSGHKAYIDYLAPNYRVRVGNFRTRLEAEALKADLIQYFPTAVVVKDKIQLPALPEFAPATE